MGVISRVRPYFLLAAASLVVFTSGAWAAKEKPPLHPINLNSASSAELQQVPGIGPSTAEKILKMRKSYGPLQRRGRSPRHQGHRPKTHGKNAQVPDGRQASGGVW